MADTIDNKINALATAIAAEIKKLRTADADLNIFTPSRWKSLYSGSATQTNVTLSEPGTNYKLLRITGGPRTDYRATYYIYGADLQSFISSKKHFYMHSCGPYQYIFDGTTSTTSSFKNLDGSDYIFKVEGWR